MLRQHTTWWWLWNWHHRLEQQRRNDVSKYKIFVKVLFNGKEVSKTESKYVVHCVGSLCFITSWLQIQQLFWSFSLILVAVIFYYLPVTFNFKGSVFFILCTSSIINELLFVLAKWSDKCCDLHLQLRMSIL